MENSLIRTKPYERKAQMFDTNSNDEGGKSGRSVRRRAPGFCKAKRCFS